MSKIIVVGHRSVDLTPLNVVLKRAGVAEANFKHKSPQEIDTIIEAVLNATPNNRNIPSIWNGLALDLLLENINQSVWGWSNPNALPILNFWKNVDPDFLFVFSYDNPALTLRLNPDDINIEEKLVDWVYYHKKLLDFYLNNRDKSILLNQQKFNRDIDSAIGFLEQNIKGLSSFQTEESPNFNRSIIQSQIAPIVETRSDAGDEVLVSEYLLKDVIQQYPDVIEVYEKLQSVADLALDDDIISSPTIAWNSFRRFQKKSEDKHKTLKNQFSNIQRELRDENNLLLGQMHWAQEEVERVFNKNLFLQTEIDGLRRKVEFLNGAKKELLLKVDWLRNGKNEYKNKNNDKISLIVELKEEIDFLKRERELSSITISKMQQSLSQKEEASLKKQRTEQEKYKKNSIQQDILINKLQENLIFEKECSLKKVHEIQEKYEELFFQRDNELNELQKALSYEKENTLNKIHKVQEEFEHIYISSFKIQNSKPLGAAQRIKNQLGYRMGGTLINKGRSITGIIFMPFYLTGTYFSYSRMMVKRKKEKKLPPIEFYQDYNDTEKIKSHLSYILGNYFVENIKKPWKWFAMPWSMRKIVKDFRSNKK